MLDKLFKPGEIVMVEYATHGGVEEEPIVLAAIEVDGFSGMMAYTSTIKWFNIHSIALHGVRALREDERRILKEELEILAERKADAGKTRGEADTGDSRGNPEFRVGKRYA